MELDKLIGQQAIIRRLKKIISDNRVGHAYAFSGPDGIGKYTFAVAFAKDLLCTGCKPERKCISCRTLMEGTNPDFYEVTAVKQSIGIDLIRALREDVSSRPAYGNRKVYLINSAQLMTVQAQNCLLKTLEEPPAYAVILLLTTSFEALLPTLQSRAVNLRLNPYTDNEMREILKSLYPIPQNQMEFIIKFSRGIPGNAIHIIEENNVKELRQLIFNLLLKPDDIYIAGDFEKTLINSREELATAFDILISVYRDCLFMMEGLENKLINRDNKDMIITIASFYSKRKLLDKITRLEMLRQNFKQNINYKLGIDMLMMEIQEV